MAGKEAAVLTPFTFDAIEVGTLEKAGGVVSTTVTVKLADEASVAVQLTVVGPSGKTLPDAGLQAICAPVSDVTL